MRQNRGISVILFNHSTDEVSTVFMGSDIFAFGVSGYPVISYVAKWWENCRLVSLVTS